MWSAIIAHSGGRLCARAAGQHAAGRAAELAEELEEDDLESSEALAILLLVFTLGGILLLGYIVEHRRISWLSEAGLGLLVGALVGAFSRWLGRDEVFKATVNFDVEFFFLALLPPIIFEAGYSMQPRVFFSNFGGICTYAFLGTSVSTLVMTLSMWGLGRLGACYSLPLLDAGLFGSLISATDPVTTLAIFSSLNADAATYYLIFGESTLNDAVAIVLYRSLLTFKRHPFTVGSIFLALGMFVLIFVGSCLIGMGVALISALLYRKAWFRDEGLDNLTLSILVLFPFFAYMAAEAAHLSGIVSILFCGITMSHYTKKNLTRRNEVVAEQIFQVLARISETFVFCYMGVSLFLEKQAWDVPGIRGVAAFVVLALLAMLLARALNVFPNSALINAWRRPRRAPAISPAQQLMLWFSGLRGAIAFALAMKSVHDIGPEGGRVVFTTTLVIVVVTVWCLGGSTTFMLNRLNLRGKEATRYGPVGAAPGSPSGDGGAVELELTALPAGGGSEIEAGGPWATPTPASEGGSSLSSLRKDLSGAASDVMEGIRKVSSIQRRPTFEDIDSQILQKLFVHSPSPGAKVSPRPESGGGEGGAGPSETAPPPGA